MLALGAPAKIPSKLRLWITDAREDAIDAVLLRVTRVEVRFKAEGGGASSYFTLFQGDQLVDLLALQGGVLGSLATTILPPGEVSEFRLVVAEAHVVVQGVTHSLQVPSGSSSGIKLKGDLTIIEDGLTDVVFDFDAARSVHQVGNQWLLQPVIRFRATTVAPGVDSSQNFFQGPERALALLHLDEARAIMDESGDSLLDLPQVLGLGVGVDETTRSLVFLAVIGTDASADDVPATLGGIPVQIERMGSPEFSDGGDNCTDPGSNCHLDTSTLPSPMGNAAEGEFTCGVPCTMGFKACDLSGNTPVFITAQHCQHDAAGCEGRAPNGSKVFHPTRYANCSTSAIQIGTLSGTSDPGMACTGSGVIAADAAKVASPSSLTTNVVRDIGVPALQTDVAIIAGDVVQKSGVRTGKTFGEIRAFPFSTSKNYQVGGTSCCSSVTYKGSNLIWAIAFTGAASPKSPPVKTAEACPSNLPNQQQLFDSDGKCGIQELGDSGSAVLTLGPLPQVVGLLNIKGHDGASGYGPAIQVIKDTLGVGLDVQNCNGGVGCTLSALAAGTPAESQTLADLRAIRDGKLSASTKGKKLIDIYEKHTREAVGIALRNPSLFVRSRAHLEKMAAMAHALTAHGVATVSSGDVQKTKELLSDFGGRGSGDFAAAVKEVQTALDDPAFLESLGVALVP